jgi:hypothetical protein
VPLREAPPVSTAELKLRVTAVAGDTARRERVIAAALTAPGMTEELFFIADSIEPPKGCRLFQPIECFLVPTLM